MSCRRSCQYRMPKAQPRPHSLTFWSSIVHLVTPPETSLLLRLSQRARMLTGSQTSTRASCTAPRLVIRH
eukprot:6199885-Pleurochrysis_carterae.AAC.2